MAAKPEVIHEHPCYTGENPLWHPDEQRIYWVDIPKGHLFWHDPAGGRTEDFEIGVDVGGFTLQEDGSLLLFMANGTVRSWRDGRPAEVLIEDIPEERGNRFNDVIADPAGRVFCGTMSTKKRAGRLYRLDTDRTLSVVLEGIGTSNGMGFTPDGSGFYYTDTHAHEIYLFDYDQASGAVANQRVFARVPQDEGQPGYPDGMTVDAEGAVWSARWDGHRIVRYSPDGRETDTIMFPVKKVSSLTFGGPDYTDIYVTTAGGFDLDDNGPLAGSLFHMNCGIRGVAEFRSRIQ